MFLPSNIGLLPMIESINGTASQNTRVDKPKGTPNMDSIIQYGMPVTVNIPIERMLTAKGS